MKLLIKLFTVLSVTACTLDLAAQVTYADDVAEIIYTKCASCHRSGEIGPMSFSNYDEVKSWGATIKAVTLSKYMPPWKADPSYSRFQAENFLTDEEISKISEWVDNGMQRGNEINEPDFPDFVAGSALGTPDLVLEMEEAYMHRGNNRDAYRYFVLPSGLTEDKVVKAMEFRPGNAQIVHHALIFEDVTGIAQQRDDATLLYGFDGFGSFNGGSQEDILNQKQYPGYVPGQKPIKYPDGTGKILSAGADVVVQVHYAPWSTDEWDQSSINIFFAEEGEVLEREVEGHIMVPLPDVINDLFIIPANQEREFHGIWELEEDLSFTGISPHMHLLGKHWEVYMEKPDGEIKNLIRINDWDFNWQGGYAFNRYITAPRGTKIHAIASYDNTADNPNNPTSPPSFVSWGEGTTDEMYYLPFDFVPYQEGDEDIIFESLGTSNTDDPSVIVGGDHIYPLTPNPVADFAAGHFKLSQGKAIHISLTNMQGQLIRTLRSSEFYNMGEHQINFSTKHLEAGTYILNIKGKNLNMSTQFVKI